MIPDFFMNAVVAIGVSNNSDTLWIGTGFFVARKISKSEFYLFLATNKHVLDGKDKLVLRFKNNVTKAIECKELDLSMAKPLIHEDPDVDIALISISGNVLSENNLIFSFFDIDEQALNSQELRNNGFNEGSFVHMLGYPLSLVDKYSNQPICRFGCIARINEEQISSNKSILLDIQNFPGNSGSPVLARPEIASIIGTNHLERAVLIGIITAYIPYRKTLIDSQTHEAVQIVSENSGLAIAYPVEYIREIINTIQPAIVDTKEHK